MSLHYFTLKEINVKKYYSHVGMIFYIYIYIYEKSLFGELTFLKNFERGINYYNEIQFWDFWQLFFFFFLLPPLTIYLFIIFATTVAFSIIINDLLINSINNLVKVSSSITLHYKVSIFV